MMLSLSWKNLNGVSDMSYFSIINQNGVPENKIISNKLKNMKKMSGDNSPLILSWENLNGVSDKSCFSIINQNGISESE